MAYLRCAAHNPRGSERLRVAPRDLYSCPSSDQRRALTRTPLKTCFEKTYVEAFRYTYCFISLIFLPTYSPPVFTSHQNVVLEIDFAGALWVCFPPSCDPCHS